MKTDRKKRNSRRGQSIAEYFVLFTVVALVTFTAFKVFFTEKDGKRGEIYQIIDKFFQGAVSRLGE